MNNSGAKTNSGGETMQPVITLTGCIGWTIRFTEIIFDDPPYLAMQAAPEFPGGNGSLTKAGIIWDPFALIESVRRPGAHQVLTCECGYAPDADLQEPVLVSHPDMNSVIWELDIPGLRPALDDAFDRDRASFLRLVFARDQYEADIRALLRGLQHASNTSFVTEALDSRIIGLTHLRSTCAACDSICVKTLEPDSQGLALERLMELDADGPWLREPMWPAGTLIEFGFFQCGDGHGLIRVNGELSGPVWPGRYLTRWNVLDAFRAWLSHTRRAFALDSLFPLPLGIGKNELVLLRESDRPCCHDAGRRLAAVMQASLEEGETAPDVTVHYCECPLYAAESGSFSAEVDEHN